MAKLHIRSASEVPQPSRAPKAARERQKMYEGFVREIGGTSIGELELSEGENLRGVKVALRRAATRIAQDIEIWDGNGRVYFRAGAPKRSRARKRS